MSNLIFILHLASTWFMTGLIWFVQVVHYPLYNRVGDNFVDYERVHCALTTAVVAPVMLCELFSGLLLLISRPRYLSLLECLLDLGALAFIWLSTFFIADQLHGALSAGFDSSVHASLVSWNWSRTIAWSFRAILLTYVLWKGLARE